MLGYRFDEIGSTQVETTITDIKLKGTFDRIWNSRRCEMVSIGLYWHGVAAPHVDCGDAPTLLHGVLKRMGAKLPDIKHLDYYQRFSSFVKRKVAVSFDVLPGDVDVTFETWIRRTNYPEWRKQELRTVYENLVSYYELNEIEHRNNKVSLLHFMINIFCKDECYNDFKAARGIFARDDIAKVTFGPWFKCIEDIVYQHPAFIKHIPVAERAKYIFDVVCREGAVYLQSDYSNFEGHFTKERQLNCEFLVYDHIMNGVSGWEDMREFMIRVLTGINRCDSKHFKVKIPAKRMSGEMNTSLGNGLFNWLNMSFMFEELFNAEAPGVVEGDDGLFAHFGTEDDAELIGKWFEENGCRIKLNVFSDVSDASFCGLLFDEYDKEIITDPYKVLAKFGWTTKQYSKANNKTISHLIRAKAMSTLVSYPACPIISELAKLGMRLTAGYDVRKYIDRKGINNYERDQLIYAVSNWKQYLHRTVGMRTRIKFAELFGISIDAQLQTEKYLRGINSFQPIILPHIALLAPTSYTTYWEKYVVSSSTPISEIDFEQPTPVLDTG